MFKEVTMMFHAGCMMLSLTAVLVAMVPLRGTETYAQDNPYRIEEDWGTLPGGRKWGGTIGVDIDRDGNIWVFERCGGTSCVGSSLAPIIKLDPSGKVLKMFVITAVRGKNRQGRPESCVIIARLKPELIIPLEISSGMIRHKY